MTIRDLMNTDCLDVDEILLVSSGTKAKKKKDVRPLAELVKDMGKE
ncbi:hypothetical protein [Enterococcus asini]|nr:hypothetical protein [Enterococcus asini]